MLKQHFYRNAIVKLDAQRSDIKVQANGTVINAPKLGSAGIDQLVDLRGDDGVSIAAKGLAKESDWMTRLRKIQVSDYKDECLNWPVTVSWIHDAIADPDAGWKRPDGSF